MKRSMTKENSEKVPIYLFCSVFHKPFEMLCRLLRRLLMGDFVSTVIICFQK